MLYLNNTKKLPSNKKPTKGKYNIKLKINDNAVSDLKHISNIFNNHFAYIGESKIKFADGKYPSLVVALWLVFYSPVISKEVINTHME